MPLFHTARLLVRHLRPADAPAMHAIYGDPEVIRYVGDGTPLPLEGCERWIEVSVRNYATKGYGACAVLEESTGAFVGCCGIVHAPGPPIGPPEIIYAFLRCCWGRGYASEVVPAMLGYAAAHHHLPQIWATIDPDNHASARILTKAGMQWQHTRPDEGGVSTWRWQAPR